MSDAAKAGRTGRSGARARTAAAALHPRLSLRLNGAGQSSLVAERRSRRGPATRPARAARLGLGPRSAASARAMRAEVLARAVGHRVVPENNGLRRECALAAGRPPQARSTLPRDSLRRAEVRVDALLGILLIRPLIELALACPHTPPPACVSSPPRSPVRSSTAPPTAARAISAPIAQAPEDGSRRSRSSSRRRASTCAPRPRPAEKASRRCCDRRCLMRPPARTALLPLRHVWQRYRLHAGFPSLGRQHDGLRP
jgi:hypothetical protein